MRRVRKHGVWLWMLLACCGRSSSERGSPTAAPSTTRPAETVSSGSALLLDASRLLLAGPHGLRRVELPVGSGSRVIAHEVPALQLVRSRNHVVAVIDDGLVLLSPDELKEEARVPLPKGSTAVAMVAEGALVASSGRLSLVDLDGRVVRWSVAIPEKARQIAVSKSGEQATVTHRLSAGPTTVQRRGASWSEQPVVEPAKGKGRVVDAIALRDGTLTIGATVRDDGYVRAGVTLRSGQLLLATDDALVTVERPRGKVLAQADHECEDARAVAVAEDETAAYLACADGAVARVVLPLSTAKPVRYVGRPTQSRFDCAGVESVDDIAAAFAGTKYVTAKQVEEILAQYHCRYPARTHLFALAETHEKRKVWAIAIGRDPWLHDRPTIFLNGGHHGDELMATTFALDAIATLLEGKVEGLDEVVFVVTPLVNPDGNAHRFAKGLGRKNGRDNDGDGKRAADEGVDLNRNYPFRWGALGEDGSRSDPSHKWYRGPAAASEPETRGVMRVANSEKFVASMSFHTGALTLCASYTIPRVKNPEPDAAMLVGWDIVTNIPPHPEGGVPVQRRLYPLDGNDQDWHRHTHGTLAFLWEGGEDWLSHEPRRFRASARGAWVALARRFLRGPSFSVNARDAAGRPLVAEVSVSEIKHFEGERWTTRCRDGRFDYMLPRAGDYTVVVRHGEVEVERPVTIAKEERIELEVRLPVLVDRPAVCPTPLADGGAPAITRKLKSEP